MNDPGIRELLKLTELLHFIEDPHSRVVEELSLPVAQARIDIAVVNGAFHGYEIKSASDNLKRLSSQIDAYSKVFDFISVVTEEKYSRHIIEDLPKWIGVYLCDEESNSIKQVRKPKQNRLRQGFFIAKLLWKEELIDCMTKLNIPFRKTDRNWLLCESLSNNLSLDDLSALVREKLKCRENWRTDNATSYYR